MFFTYVTPRIFSDILKIFLIDFKIGLNLSYIHLVYDQNQE